MGGTVAHPQADHDRGGRSGLHRSRWAAIGAAVAVTFGAGSAIHLVGAASSDPSSLVSITPMRILDTRDPTNLGLAGPFVSAAAQDLQVTGDIPTLAGIATVVPSGATSVVMNMTVVQPTADGFLSVQPADAPGAPQTSSLNFTAGAIIPNAVIVALPTSGADAGAIEITYDAFGTVGPTTDVLVDVVGYTVEAAPAAPKSMSLPITGGDTNAVFTAALPGGLRFPDNAFPTYISLDHSFVLPADYTSGTPIEIDLIWVLQGNCRAALIRNNLTVTRPGIPPIQGPNTSAGLSIAPTPIATNGVVNSTVMTIVSPNPAIPLEPGDAITFGMYRAGDSAADTCTGQLLILTGIMVRYQ